MNSRQFFLIILIVLSTCNFAKAQEYASFLIPKELKKEADVVVRNSETTFEVISKTKSIHTVKKVITVLNKEGDRQAQLHIAYDKHSVVRKASAKMYNGLGKVTEKYGKKDFKDYSNISNFSIYEDNRVLHMRPVGISYPFTIEYEYEIEYKTSLFYPRWFPLDSERKSVQKASFTAIVPNGLTFRYKECNLKDDVLAISNIDGKKVYKWSVKNLKSLESEPYWESFRSVVPYVYTAPSEFGMDGYEGNMQTWNGFAKWFNLLNDGRDEVPEETGKIVSKLVSGISDRKEKVKKIYEYLQNNTRYVSIQLGIGGFQSFDAESTAENGYGDCKALTTYTKGMLKSAGIESNYVLVKAGRNASPILTDFPSSQFNHVFLCVPNVAADTIWLECTNQNVPFGYLGYFTSDRNVLIALKNSGKMVRTPVYKQEDNLQLRNAEVEIDTKGDAVANITTKYTGLQYENDGMNFRLGDSKEEQKKWLYKKIDIPSFEINDFSFDVNKDIIPSVEEVLSLNLRKFASQSGNRLFIKPNILNKWSYMPSAVESRKTEFVIKTAYTDIDSISYQFPEKYHIEHAPGKKEISTDFGEYTTEIIKQDNNRILFIRTLRINKGIFPPDKYENYMDFRKEIIKADKQKVVLVSAT